MVLGILLIISGVLTIIKLLVGLELLFNGWTWIMLSLAIRQMPEAEEVAGKIAGSE